MNISLTYDVHCIATYRPDMPVVERVYLYTEECAAFVLDDKLGRKIRGQRYIFFSRKKSQNVKKIDRMSRMMLKYNFVN